jgi:glycosyltransferase involved in cell wall biosynthesis
MKINKLESKFYRGNANSDMREKKIIVVMPAYNAELTLEKTFQDIPKGSVDEIILTDDASTDRTVEIAKRLGVTVICHDKNYGYGANQKTCYHAALERGATVVIMIHPDYQYDSRLIPYAVGFLEEGVCDVIVGSRIRTRREALDGGMPIYKYIANRFLTTVENIILGQNLGDFHSGFRAYTREVITKIPYRQNSDDFVFDTEFLSQAIFFGFRIGDVPVPTRYFDEASSINFTRSVKYGIQTLWVMVKFIIQKLDLFEFNMFNRVQCNSPSKDLT